MEETIRDLQSTFDTAELNADAETVDRLIADDFRSIGARAFVLEKKEWIDRHVHFEYHALETSDMDSRYQPAEEAWPVRAARARRRTRGSRRRAGQQLGYRPGPTAAPASDACAFLRRLAAKSSRELRFASEGDLGWKGRSGCWEVRRERSNRRRLL